MSRSGGRRAIETRPFGARHRRFGHGFPPFVGFSTTSRQGHAILPGKEDKR
jgi:hypothetical protein